VELATLIAASVAVAATMTAAQACFGVLGWLAVVLGWLFVAFLFARNS
jgi:hypothetical protein